MIFVVASPEYNASMPGVLKNAIDWVSRYQPQPFNERHGLLMSASPSMDGATAACGRCAVDGDALLVHLARPNKVCGDAGTADRAVDRVPEDQAA